MVKSGFGTMWVCVMISVTLFNKTKRDSCQLRRSEQGAKVATSLHFPLKEFTIKMQFKRGFPSSL